ncbi:hypothetical protein PMAYCL1PPCAC_22030, partial [Pristionchus mayeri]
EFRPLSTIICRVRSTLDDICLFDLRERIVKRLEIHAPWLPSCPLYAMCHSINHDGKYCSTERGGPLVRRRGLRRPTDPPYSDHVVVVPLAGILRLEELASYRVLAMIPRDQRYHLLKSGIVSTPKLLKYLGREPYS